MKKYRAAVVGSGRIGLLWEFIPKRPKPATHIGAFLRHPRIELVSVVEIDPATIKKAKSFLRNKVPVYQDVKKALHETKPEIVAIATPDETHREMVEAAVAGGTKLIICEKPIATNLRDAEAMIKLCRARGVILLVNHMRRFDPELKAVAEKIREGAFGKIQQIRCLYPNGLLNNGTHAIDFIRWAGGEIKNVFGWKNPFPSFAHNDDYNIDGIMALKDGGSVTLQSLNKEDYSVFDIEFFGTKGAILVRNLGFTIDILRPKKGHLFGSLKELDIHNVERKTHERGFFEAMAEHAVRCLDGKEKPESKGEDGLEALRILLAFRKSAETGKIVTP